MRLSYFLLYLTSLFIFLIGCSGPATEKTSTDSAIAAVVDTMAINESEIIKETLVIDNSTKYRSRTETEIRNNPQTIADYYLIFPIPRGFQVKQDNEIWSEFKARISSLEPAEMVTLVVDTVNAYISIIDNNNELSHEMQMTYFVGKDGSKYIAARFYGEGGDCDTEIFTVQQYQNNEWKDVTQQVLPKLSITDFCSTETLPPADLQKFDISYTLPRKGTTLKANASAVCEMDEFFYNRDAGFMENYYTTFKKANCKELSLSWNKTKAVFELKK